MKIALDNLKNECDEFYMDLDLILTKVNHYSSEGMDYALFEQVV